MRSKIIEIIQKELAKYKVKEIALNGEKYNLYIFQENPHANLYEGFLFSKVTEAQRIREFKKIDPYKEGKAYCPRILIIEDVEKGSLFIRDTLSNKHIIKTLRKINKTFLNKLKKALSDPKEEHLNKLFDRSDVIEEFYILYKKTREYMLKNIKGIPEEDKRKEFVDNFMIQMLTLWYLQERGFFNNDKNYFITKFRELKQKKELKQKNRFNSYYEFLTYLFDKISGYEDKQYYKDDDTGEVVVIGPGVFLNGKQNEAISIPDECFYKEGITDILINTPPRKVTHEVPLLNLFESRDWTEGNIDEFVLGSIFEKLMNYDERKKTGAYYTPEAITSYICKNTIEPYLIDRVNEEFGKNYGSIDQVVESNDKKTLLYLFDQLEDIKILDPAVGSGHFLESAINVLVSIYEKIWRKAKELDLKGKFVIKAANEKGEIQDIDLVEISDEEEFKLLVKFFIILSKNIYGVDINPSALKVARARLFLTLAKHFKTRKGKDVFIRFPNVHFNLREGNSLIGYIELKKEDKAKQLTLFDFIAKDEQVKYITEKIKIVSELKPYIEKTAKSLKLGGSIVKEIEELNKILSKKKIDWKDFEKVLRTKEKLIRILIVTLNSKYAKPLNDLLKEITNLFNQKLDEKFAEEHGIKLEDLKKIKTFHWIFEFPEVFLEKRGFDVVVGNPPYVRQEDINKIVAGVDYKSVLSEVYEIYDNTFDLSMFFVLRSLEICKDGGYHAFIITNKWLRAKYGKKIRQFLKDNVTIKKVIDFNGIRVFVGATIDTLVYVIQKKKPERENQIFYNHPMSLENLEQGGYKVKQSSLSDDVWSFVSEEIGEVKNWIEKVGKPLKELDVKIYRGITTGFNEAFIIDNETKEKLIKEDPKSAELIKPLLRGRDIGRYYAEWDKKWIITTFPALHIDINNYPAIKNYLASFGERLLQDGKPGHRKKTGNKWFETQDQIAYYPEFEKPKIVWQETGQLFNLWYDCNRFYPLKTIFIIVGNNIKLLLQILNSRFTNMYLIPTYVQLLGGKGYSFSKIYIEKIPIRLPKTSKHYETLTDYLLFLNAKQEWRENLKEIIEFFDRKIADSLVYELYFKEKFHEDGLYPEPKEYLLQAVAKHLKPINYDRWAELYWKKQLEGSLTENEEKELQKLEIDNMKTIQEVYNNIIGDEEIQGWIDKIKSHQWVKVIEGEK